ncbi:MAG: molybdopterin-dependent oxidoreductase, partial [Candidatus Promineifilaceae bacterium]|nr:molybdopterin-dependent oxidoreductase [Candidatus Promineifilaceae bacterium]
LHDRPWLEAHALGWERLRRRLDAYPPERVAALTGLAEDDIVALARLYAQRRPGLIKIADGVNRNFNGGQAVRAICALPALTGQYGLPGAGLAYSVSGSLTWDAEAVHKWSHCPPPARHVNMNRLGVALLGEVDDPPIQALYVFGANPVASTPNAGAIVAGLQRVDLFTVVHELFMTDTADYADFVLPATSQLEQVDVHKAYGHPTLSYNAPALQPLGESRSNWDTLRALAKALNLDDPWLHQSGEEVLDEVLAATAAHEPALAGVDLARLQRETHVPLAVDEVPFADGRFHTASGRVELYVESLADRDLDPLPGYAADARDPVKAPEGADPGAALQLVSAAAHHFVSSSLANQAGLQRRQGPPRVEVHPQDAAARGIRPGDRVTLANARGWVSLEAVVTDAVRPGVVASPKGHWAKLNGGRNLNWLTSASLADLGGGSTFHSTRVWLRKGAPSALEDGSNSGIIVKAGSKKGS